MSDYKVIDGIIVSPGKFEAEPAYAPHYWDLALSGCQHETIYDEHDRIIEICLVTEDDRRLFSDLRTGEIYAVGLTESESGFVTSSAFATVEDLNSFRSSIDRAIERAARNGDR